MNKEKSSKKMNLADILGRKGISYCKLMEANVKFPSHISNRLPQDYIVIRCMKNEFFDAIHQLNKQDVIGLSLEGHDIGRTGSLEWLNISSSTCTYLFNIANLGKDAFAKGLKRILENKRIVKAMHDCRRASDCFYHQYNTKPSNVYDTQLADFLVNVIKQKVELMTNKVNSLNYCLKLYLNVPKEYLFNHFNGSVKLNTLPLNQDLLEFLVKNVIYLRLLKQEQDMILRMPFRRCVDVFLNVLLKKSDEELQLHNTNLQLLPPELVLEKIQVFKITDKLKPSESPKLEDKEDPYIRYERDCRKYQRQYGYGKYADDKELELDCENVDAGWSYSNRNEIVQFLLDRMFSCDSSDISVVDMTPFEDLSEKDMCSTTLGNDLKHERENLSVPNCISKNSEFSNADLSSSSKPLKTTVHLDPPFENLSSSNDSWISQENNYAPAVDIKLSNVTTLPNAAGHEDLLPVQKQLPSDSVVLANDSMSNENCISAIRDSNNVKDLVGDNLSGSSLSGKFQIYKIFAEQKRLLNSQTQVASNLPITSNKSISDNGVLSTVINSNSVKNPVSNTSSLEASSSSGAASSKIPSLSDKLKKLLNSKTPARGQYISENDSSIGSDVQSSMPSNEGGHSCYHKKDYSSENILNSKNRHLDSFEQSNSLEDKSSNEENSVSYDSNFCVDKNNSSNSAVNQDEEDPWARLRAAFAELGPTRYSSKKVVFVPAGMQC